MSEPCVHALSALFAIVAGDPHGVGFDRLQADLTDCFWVDGMDNVCEVRHFVQSWIVFWYFAFLIVLVLVSVSCDWRWFTLDIVQLSL